MERQQRVFSMCGGEGKKAFRASPRGPYLTMIG